MTTLHHVPLSRSFRTLWLLHELDLKFQVKTYQIGDESMRDPAFLAVSPLGRVPALEIDGKVIFESGAITQYLCESRPLAGLAPKQDDPERVAYLQWLSFAETQASIIQDLNLQMIFLRPPAKPSVVVLKIQVARLKATLAPLEEVFSKRNWLLERGFSAADTMLGFNLMAVGHFVDLEAFPSLRAYITRMQARPAFVKAMEVEGDAQFYDKPFYAVEDFA